MKDKEKKSVYDKLTPERKQLVDEMLNNLKNNNGLWRQGWHVTGAPVSAISGKRYSGVNRLFLTMATMQKGYSDNRWLTYRQMEEKGWHFKRDAEGNSMGKDAGVAIEFYSIQDKKTKLPFNSSTLDGMTDAEKEDYMKENIYNLHKYYCVFNGDVIEGIPAREQYKVDPSGKNSRVESFLQYWSDNESEIIYSGDEAFYNKETDKVHSPPKEQFVDLLEYYATNIHEIGHSTGHRKRLNRDLSGKFGSAEYAEEELCAEIASMFIVQDLGVVVEKKHIQNNSAYIKYWHDKIKDDPNILFKAIAEAEKISKYVAEKEHQATAEKIARLKAVEEEKSEIYLQPSEVAAIATEEAAVVETVAAVEMTGKGIESLTRMDDRDVVDKASKTKHGEKFLALFNGESVLGTVEQNERSLMARLAMHTNDLEQLLRIFHVSGQFREDKPNGYYEGIAKEEMQFVANLKNSIPIAVAAKNAGSRFANTKS